MIGTLVRVIDDSMVLDGVFYIQGTAEAQGSQRVNRLQHRAETD